VGDGVVGFVSGACVGGWDSAGGCAAVAAGAAGSAGVAGAGEACAGDAEAVVAELLPGAGDAVGSVAPGVARVELAALALAGLPGSAVLADGDFGVDGVPAAPIAAANALMCVRTCWSLVRAVSSSVIDAEDLPLVVVFGAVAVEPVVPVGAGVEAPVVLEGSSSSLRMRSAAAASLVQLALRPVVLPEAGFCAACSRALKWRFSSATRVFAVPVSDVSGMSASADCACRRCSFAEPCFASAPGVRSACGAGAVLLGRGAVDGVGCWAQLPTGMASSADAATAVVQLAVERFIAWLLP
jgi:hypothetical protein